MPFTASSTPACSSQPAQGMDGVGAQGNMLGRRAAQGLGSDARRMQGAAEHGLWVLSAPRLSACLPGECQLRRRPLLTAPGLVMPRKTAAPCPCASLMSICSPNLASPVPACPTQSTHLVCH